MRRHLLRLWLKIDKLRALELRLLEYGAASGWSRREGLRPLDAPRKNTEMPPLLLVS